jgi:hypothetical protein
MPPSSPFSREGAVHPKPGSRLPSVMDRETSQCSTPSPSRAHRTTSRVNDGRYRPRKPSARPTSTRSRCALSRQRNPVLWTLAYGPRFEHIQAPGPIIRLNLRGQDDTLRQYATFVKFTVRMYRLLNVNLVFGGEPRVGLAYRVAEVLLGFGSGSTGGRAGYRGVGSCRAPCPSPGPRGSGSC